MRVEQRTPKGHPASAPRLITSSTLAAVASIAGVQRRVAIIYLRLFQAPHTYLLHAYLPADVSDTPWLESFWDYTTDNAPAVLGHVGMARCHTIAGGTGTWPIQ